MYNTPTPHCVNTALKSDCFYAKYFSEEKTTKYAYFHMDNDDSEYTFLIVFNTCDAENYQIYHTYGRTNGEREYHKRNIQEFTQEVDEVDPQELRKDLPRWKYLNKHDMVLDERALNIVRKQHQEIKRLKNKK